MTWSWIAWIRLAAAALLTSCGGSSRDSGPYMSFNPGPTPPEVHRGEVVFNTFCMSCHGRHGRGEGLGPALLDSIFAPSRVSEEAFYRAIQQGVSQRHYHYGAMPPVKPVNRADAAEVFRYVRWLQEKAASTEVRDSTMR
jgi:mono/diheme cytochrome c family protein